MRRAMQGTVAPMSIRRWRTSWFGIRCPILARDDFSTTHFIPRWLRRVQGPVWELAPGSAFPVDVYSALGDIWGKVSRCAMLTTPRDTEDGGRENSEVGFCMSYRSPSALSTVTRWPFPRSSQGTTTSTTFLPVYHHEMRTYDNKCEGLRKTEIVLRSLRPKGLRAFRRAERASFPSWTSRVRIPSPAL